MSIVKFYFRAFSGLPAGVWAIVFVLFVHRSGTMVLPFLSLHLKDHIGLAAGTAAQLLSVYGVGSVIGSLGGGRMCERFGSVRVMAVGFACPVSNGNVRSIIVPNDIFDRQSPG